MASRDGNDVTGTNDVTGKKTASCNPGCFFEKYFVSCTTSLPTSCLPSVVLKLPNNEITTQMWDVRNLHIGILLNDGIVLHYHAAGLSLAEKWTNCIKVPIPTLNIKVVRCALLQYCVTLVSDVNSQEGKWACRNYHSESNNCLDFVIDCLVHCCAIQQNASKCDFVSQFISPFWCFSCAEKFARSGCES